MGWLGDSGSSSTVSNEFKPPSWTTDGSANGGTWQNYLARAADLTATPAPMYAGQRVADLSPQTYDAMDLITQTAMNSSPDVLAGRGAVADIAGGRYLNANPYLSPQYTNAVIGDTAGNMARAFAQGTAADTAAAANQQGAYGGSAYNQKQAMNAQGLAQSVGQMANQYQLANQQLGANNYNTGIGQMLGAAQLAPQGQQMDLQAGQALAGVGDMQRSYSQQLLDSLYNTWQGGQMQPYQNLDIMGNALSRASGGIAGGYTSAQQQSGGGFSPIAGLLGGGLMAYGMS